MQINGMTIQHSLEEAYKESTKTQKAIREAVASSFDKDRVVLQFKEA